MVFSNCYFQLARQDITKQLEQCKLGKLSKHISYADDCSGRLSNMN